MVTLMFKSGSHYFLVILMLSDTADMVVVDDTLTVMSWNS